MHLGRASSRDRRSPSATELVQSAGDALGPIGQPSTVAVLPPRLRQTLACLLQGKREKEVADELGLSPSTVHEYVRSLYRRFGVSSRAELSARFLNLAWVTGREPDAAPRRRTSCGS